MPSRFEFSPFSPADLGESDSPVLSLGDLLSPKKQAKPSLGPALPGQESDSLDIFRSPFSKDPPSSLFVSVMKSVRPRRSKQSAIEGEGSSIDQGQQAASVNGQAASQSPADAHGRAEASPGRLSFDSHEIFPGHPRTEGGAGAARGEKLENGGAAKIVYEAESSKELPFLTGADVLKAHGIASRLSTELSHVEPADSGLLVELRKLCAQLNPKMLALSDLKDPAWQEETHAQLEKVGRSLAIDGYEDAALRLAEFIH